jgi:hypothetical protein
VPPDEQHPVSAVDGHHPGSGRGANPAVRKMAAVRKFYVGQAYIQPLIGVQGPVRDDFPPHQRYETGKKPWSRGAAQLIVERPSPVTVLP